MPDTPSRLWTDTLAGPAIIGLQLRLGKWGAGTPVPCAGFKEETIW